MKTKNFFLSKINWTAIILILVALQDAIANLDLHAMHAKDWVLFGFGALIIVLRTWFTNTAIATKQPPEEPTAEKP